MPALISVTLATLAAVFFGRSLHLSSPHRTLLPLPFDSPTSRLTRLRNAISVLDTRLETLISHLSSFKVHETKLTTVRERLIIVFESGDRTVRERKTAWKRWKRMGLEVNKISGKRKGVMKKILEVRREREGLEEEVVGLLMPERPPGRGWVVALREGLRRRE